MTDDVLLTLSLLLMGALLARFVASLIGVPEILVLVAIGACFGPSALDGPAELATDQGPVYLAAVIDGEIS